MVHHEGASRSFLLFYKISLSVKRGKVTLFWVLRSLEGDEMLMR